MALTKIKLNTMVTGNLSDANIPDNITIDNAATATALETARTIHGVSFDGTANIDLTEAIQDVVGGMVASNTETNIDVTYDDTNGKLDFASTNTTYSVGDGGLTQNNFTDALKTKLDGIAASANNYSLPLATSSTRGGVKIGYSENGKNYPVELDSEKMYVNVPWTDTNTTYSVGDGGLTQNNFTNALKSKLDGIEAGATADQDLSGYATLSGATFSGAVTFDASPVFSTGADGTLANRDGFTDFIGYNSTYGSYIGGGAGNASRYIYAGGYFYDGSNVRTLWHTGNDGSGSGLDADLWDGNEFSSYLNQGVKTTSNPTFNQIYANDWFRVNGNDGIYWQDHGGGWYMTDSTWIRSYNSKYVYVDQLLAANLLNVGTTGGITPTQHDNTPLVGSKTNIVARFNGSIHLDGNNDSISFGSGTGTFLHDEELGFGWGGGIYMTDGDWVRIRNAKNVYASSGHFRGGRFSDGSSGSYYVEPNNSSAIKLQTTNGYVQIGPMNSSYCHYNTDRAKHWFNVQVEIQGDCMPHIANSYALGSESKRWQNLYINNIAKVGQLKLNNSFILRQGASDYGEFTSWLQGGGNHGIYFPSATATSSPHIYPNGGYASYGTFRVTGHTGGYPGIIMGSHSNKPTFMVADSTSSGGLYYTGTGRWAYYHNYGHNCLGVGHSTTSSSYELYVHGDVYATGSYSNSDIRMKENIKTIDSGIEKVMNMRGVYFDWINKEKGEGRQTGVIAQEMNEVLPEAVVHAEDIDEYSVDYSKITGVLIEAIKDLKNEINQLKEGCCNGSTKIN